MARETQGSPAGEKKLEQYGVWVKVKPREVVDAAARDDSFELSDLEASRDTAVAVAPPQDESALTSEEEQLLDELETELGPEDSSADLLVPDEEPLLAEEVGLPDIESVAGESPAEEIAFGDAFEEELPELEDDLTPAPRKADSAGADDEVEITLSEDAVKEEKFDDLEALENELASVAAPRASGSSSAGILSRIEEELRSIRADLTHLRGELSGLRARAAEPGPEALAAKAEAQTGFLDEDEDETIALTGDELDNILNTADITEEAAETPASAALTSAPPASLEPVTSAPQDDILSYDTLSLAEADTVIPVQDETAGATLEELPDELVLDELASETVASFSLPEGLEELPELELEGIPEMETPTEPAAGDETIDLDTLDLGEAPTVIEAVPEQVDELEAIPEDEPLDAVDALADEVDLEALAAEAEDFEDVKQATPLDDLEIGELEAVPEDAEEAEAPQTEIEITFETESEPAAQALEPAAEPADELLEIEEVSEMEPSPAAAQPAAETGIPENLKDEIRTVLKYMDTLLEALPDEKIKEFASSDYFVMYKKLFEDLGLGE